MGNNNIATIASVLDIFEARKIDINDTIYAQSSADMLDFKIVSKDFYEARKNKDEKYELHYKNTVEIMDFPMITDRFPQLLSLDYHGRDKLPYFVAGLEELSLAISQGEEVAVEGGPCLFGTHEVKVSVRCKKGAEYRFDFNTGKSYSDTWQINGRSVLADFMREYGREVVSIDFENRKEDLTPQEWLFIKYPFEIAKAFGAPLVIPIPDLSYIKYLDAVLSNTDKAVRDRALSDFRQLSYDICDQYLAFIDEMKAVYSDVRCDVVHDRDLELLKKYYEARAPFIERGKVLHGLTSVSEKLESVKDYISMPALPYYLYGIKNIIEVDSMDETDTYRKCRKAHKKAISLSCILLPEFLAKDRTHTIFDAPRNMKEYGEYVRETKA